MVVSYDIFDTLITRRTLNSLGTFSILQSRLKEIDSDINPFILENYASIRREAESNSKFWAKQNGKEEICLFDIYKEIQSMTLLPNAVINQIMELEKEIEKSNSVLIMNTVNQLKKDIHEGKRVILISDMYLPTSFIVDILNSADPVFSSLPIYVSCDHGKTKNSGSLYLHVAQQENIEDEAWIHYGDDIHSDYRIPRLIGIQAHLVTREKLMPWERYLVNRYDLDGNPELQLYLGNIKCIRQNNNLDEASNFGVSLGGISFFSFCSWVVDNCELLNINRLYFLARDGYVIKKMTDAIIKERQIPLKTKYIYGSRQAWRTQREEDIETLKGYIFQEMSFDDNNYAFVDVQGSGTTIEKFANRFLPDSSKGKIKVFCFNFFRKISDATCVYFPYFSDKRSRFCESLSRAPHGITLGYTKENEKYCPRLFRESDSEVWKRSGLEEYANGAELFAQEMQQSLRAIKMKLTSKLYSRAIIEYCETGNDETLMSFFGMMPHGDMAEEGERMFAPILSYSDIMNIFLRRSAQPLEYYYKGTNLEYSLMRIGERKRKVVDLCKRYHYSKLGRLLWSRKGVEIICSKYQIVIYGAGEAGKRLYAKMWLGNPSSIVGWVDLNFQSLRDQGYPVQDPQEVITKKQFDYIVITISNELAKRTLGQTLQKICCKDKIIQLEEYYQLIGKTE